MLTNLTKKPRNRIWKRPLLTAFCFVLAALSLALFDRPLPVMANSCPGAEFEWYENKNPRFAFLYTLHNRELGTHFFYNYGDALHRDYQELATLFGIQLSLPLNIRIYPTQEDYECLNPTSPPVSGLTFHSLIGVKEIVLIGDRIPAESENQDAAILNALRAEMAMLFVKQITGDQALPGLTAGTAIYLQDPAYNFEDRFTLSDPTQITLPANLTWRQVWEQTETEPYYASARNAMSITAYLVDAYGWPNFRSFLDALAVSDTYSQALFNIYGIELAALQDQWAQYYPLYFSGRWRSHPLFDFDFTEFESLIEAGAYTDTIVELQKAITFLETIEKDADVAYARELLQQAEQGQAAGALVRQTRQSLQSRSYTLTIDLAAQAETAYLALNDIRRLQEIEAYRVWAEDVLALRQDLTGWQEKIDASADVSDEEILQLKQLHQDLGKLGDVESGAAIEELLQTINNYRQQKAERMTILGSVVACALVLLRWIIGWRKQPNETKLI